MVTSVIMSSVSYVLKEPNRGVNTFDFRMARSTNITGPYISYEHNPVLTNANTSLYRKSGTNLFYGSIKVKSPIYLII